jgi:hypothetical protein
VATNYSQLNNYQWSYNYFSGSTSTVTSIDLNAYSNEIIPAGQSRYYTIAYYSYNAHVNTTIQVLSVNSINGTTFAGVSALGGVKTTEVFATFHSVNTNTGTSISPYGEQLIYTFNGQSDGSYNGTNLNSIVVTLTGNIDLSNVSSVNLRYFNSDYSGNESFTNANTFSSVNNPGSNVITFSGNGGYMYSYSYPNKANFFITVQLNNTVSSTIAGQTMGVAAIDQSLITVQNSYTAGATVLGSSLQTGATYTYSFPSSVYLASNALLGNTLLGVNQGITPIYSLQIVTSGNVGINNLNFTTTGTYSNSDINGFHLYSANTSVLGTNYNNVTYSTSNSTGSGEVLSFNISQNILQGTTYFFIVPDVANSTASGATIMVKAIPASAFILSNTITGVTSSLTNGNVFSIAQPSVTFTGIPTGGVALALGGYAKAYTIQVNSAVAFNLNTLAYTTNGMYDNSGLNRFYIDFSTNLMSNYKDNSTVYRSYSKSSNLNVLTTSGETIQQNVNQVIPAGQSYITIFVRATSNSSYIYQSFGIAGMQTSITTITGSTITYANNVAGTPSTITSQLVTLTSIALTSNKIYRADNQILYAAKYMSNVTDNFNYFGIWMKGNYSYTDFKAAPASSINVWLSTSPGLNTSTAIKMSDPSKGASSEDLTNNWYEFNNTNINLEANMPYYVYITADISTSATFGDSIRVYGEDPNNFDNNFNFEPSSNYNYDKNACVINYGLDMIITANANPSITFSGATLTVGGASLDISTLFATNSPGTVTYSIISGTAASLSGSILTPVSGGQVTITGYVNSATGLNAGMVWAVFTVDAKPLITFSGTFLAKGTSIDLSTLFMTNSSGSVTFSITSGTDATLNGSVLSIGTSVVTVTGFVSAAPNFIAGSQTAIFSATENIAEALHSSIKFYPNPTTGLVNVTGNFDDITVYDILGNTILTSVKNTFDLGSFSNGVYLVKAKKGDYSVFNRIVKK